MESRIQNPEYLTGGNVPLISKRVNLKIQQIKINKKNIKKVVKFTMKTTIKLYVKLLKTTLLYRCLKEAVELL